MARQMHHSNAPPIGFQRVNRAVLFVGEGATRDVRDEQTGLRIGGARCLVHCGQRRGLVALSTAA